jgi:hypothetical protein
MAVFRSGLQPDRIDPKRIIAEDFRAIDGDDYDRRRG